MPDEGSTLEAAGRACEIKRQAPDPVRSRSWCWSGSAVHRKPDYCSPRTGGHTSRNSAIARGPLASRSRPIESDRLRTEVGHGHFRYHVVQHHRFLLHRGSRCPSTLKPSMSTASFALWSRCGSKSTRRSRCRRHHAPDEPPLADAGPLLPPLPEHSHRAAPVSYTHLTLPTIPFECRSRWSPYH